MAVQREKAIQSQGVQLLATVGAAVYVTGTRRSRGNRCRKCGEFVPGDMGTRMTPGIPDVFAFLPQRRPYRGMAGENWTASVLLFWEAKAPGGRQSAEQKGFRLLCENAGIPYVLGDLDALIAWLCERGYCKASQFPFYRQPKAVGASC